MTAANSCSMPCVLVTWWSCRTPEQRGARGLEGSALMIAAGGCSVYLRALFCKSQDLGPHEAWGVSPQEAG